jgi:putative CocE/NonD family hydrolase
MPGPDLPQDRIQVGVSVHFDSAWRVSPQAHLDARQPTHRLPGSPVSLYVTMRDGVRLAVDCYLPQGSGTDTTTPQTFSTILIQTPYYRRFRMMDGADPLSEDAPNVAIFRDLFVPRGYALVVVDVRGSGASFGVREGFRSPAEREDGRELIDWIVAQDWSNGRIGSTGISYVGAAADFLASTGHPAVRAIAPLFAVWDTHSDHYYPGGILLNRLADAYDRLMKALDHDRRDLLGEFAYFRNPDFCGPIPVDDDVDGTGIEQAVRQHRGNFRMPDFIREFAFKGEGLPYDPIFTSDAFSPYAYMEGVSPDVACLGVSGWYDGAGFSNAAITRFRSLPGKRKHLLLGPWDHGARTNISPFRESEAVTFPVLGEVLRFFDHYLDEQDNGFDQEAPIHYYTLADEEWRAASAWPPVGYSLRLDLAGGGGLESGQVAAAETEYAVDFSLGTGNKTRFARLQALAVSEYYADWDGRSRDMACFTSQPLEADFVLSGHPVLTLHLGADTPDAAIHAYLEEVDQAGRCLYVTEGMLRALHRQEGAAPANQKVVGPYRSFRREHALPLTPGVPETLRFALLPISWTFRQGCRIRVAIAGADSDNCVQVPHGRPPRLTIHHGGQDGSFIELPGEMRERPRIPERDA